MQNLCKPCCTGSRNENYLEVDNDDSSEPAQDEFYETSEKKKTEGNVTNHKWRKKQWKPATYTNPH